MGWWKFNLNLIEEIPVNMGTNPILLLGYIFGAADEKLA